MAGNGWLASVEERLGEKIDRVGFVLQDHAPAAGMTPSQVARKARVTTREAYEALEWMLARRLARSSGNGAWTRYHPWWRPS